MSYKFKIGDLVYIKNEYLDRLQGSHCKWDEDFISARDAPLLIVHIDIDGALLCSNPNEEKWGAISRDFAGKKVKSWWISPDGVEYRGFGNTISLYELNSSLK